MTIPTCTRQFGIDAAHRVLEHESKCKHIHGHRWSIEVTCQAQELDRLGRVIDFGIIKSVFGKWLDDHLDHNVILNQDDPLLDLPKDLYQKVFGGKEPYVLPFNPTSENLSRVLFDVANQWLQPYGVKCVAIRVYETPTCWADYTPDLTR